MTVAAHWFDYQKRAHTGSPFSFTRITVGKTIRDHKQKPLVEWRFKGSA